MALPEGFELVNQPPEGFEVQRKSFFPTLPEGFELLSEVESGFFGKIKESLYRGREQTLANIGIYEANYGDADLQGALNLRKRLLAKAQLSPIEGNFLSDLVYSSSRTVGQMWESTKRAGKGAIVGAAVGGVGGVGVGLLAGGITGEEAPLGLAGAKLGARVGAGVGAAAFSFREGFGAMYAEMIDNGTDPKIAKQFATYGAIPYAMVEVLQLKTAAPAVKEGLQAIINKAQQKVLKKAVKTYGKRLTAEIIQEMGQEVIQIAATDMASHLSKNDIEINTDYIKSRALRLYGVAKESAKAFALIPAPGVAIEAAMQSSANQAAREYQATIAETEAKDLQRYTGKVPAPQQNVFETEDGVLSFDESKLKQRELEDGTTEIYDPETDEKLTLNPEYTRGMNETAESWTQRVTGLPMQTETKVGLTPTDVDQPVGQFQIAIDNALSESVRTFEMQDKLRAAEKAEKFGEMESIANQSTSADWRVQAKSALKGAYAKLDIKPLQEVIPIESFRRMDQELRTTDKLKRIDAINLGDAMQALYDKGKVLRPFEIKLARKMWGDRLADTLGDLAEASKGGKISIVDYISIPKAVMASSDISRTLRQNILMARKPVLWAKALGRDVELMVKDARHARTIENMAIRENSDLIQKSNIRINKWGEQATARTGSERFPSKLARQVPFIARSERAYVVGGNMIRMNYLREIAQQREGTVTTEKQWKDIGHVLNIITGEGDAKLLGDLAPILNAIFFAPRLLESRIRAFTDLLNPNLSWAARKILAQHIAAFVALNSAILASMSLVPGVNVERDYRSTDFGKIKIGNTRIDFWGGYLPLARLMTRLSSGETKSSSGRVVPIEARETITSFLQSKLGPMPAYVIDLLKGETFVGDGVSLEADSVVEQFYQRFTPLFFQDMIDAVRYNGLDVGSVASGALAFFGASVVSYPKSKFTEVSDRKNLITQEAVGQNWDDVGPDIQAMMKANYPQIEQMERQARFDREGFGFLERMADQREKSVRKMYKAMPADIQEEFDSLGLKLSGVSSRIGTDWYLNEERRKQYENKTTFLYKTVLTKLIRSPKWASVPPIIKINLLSKVMDELKKKVRDDILYQARVEDIKRIKRRRN